MLAQSTLIDTNVDKKNNKLLFKGNILKKMSSKITTNIQNMDIQTLEAALLILSLEEYQERDHS